MTAGRFTESTVEEAALEWLRALGYAYVAGPDITPDGPYPERETYQQVVLVDRLQAAIARINPQSSEIGRDEAIRQLLHIGVPSLVQSNRAAHKLMVDGISVEVLINGKIRGELIKPIDFDHPANNQFLAVNQFTVVEGNIERRPDIVVFINGIPVVVIELKNAADVSATVEDAYNQLQTYKLQIPSLFRTNELLVVSDGGESLLGTISSNRERFAAWKTVDGETFVPNPTLETLIKGALEPGRLLDLIRSFIVFEDDGKSTVKKVAQYHQFHAVRKAMSTAGQASRAGGDGRGGVLWHTQGSGKSLTMLFFAGKLIQAMQNPTVVMLTDRNDLDDQLFGTFSMGAELVRQTPAQAESRDHLRELLAVEAGGVVFTTIQKFLPEPGVEETEPLTKRRNVFVMADEAHRSQYGFGTRVGESGKFVRGLAQHMHDSLPNATFIAFTGTPLELADKDTRIVFGDYIDIYDVSRAIADKSTVPIYYESRLIKLDLKDGESGLLDEEFEELTEDEEETRRDKLKTKWSQLEAVVGTPKRLAQVAQDIVEHMRLRQEAMTGKIMVVCMSRRICVDLYDQLVKLHPEWHADEDAQGAIKIVMTGSASDKLEWQPHIRNKQRREALAARFKDPEDPFQIVIVRDMWLTGFDVPSLHTMYLDKPMKGHGLMQAIARVNRIFGNKPGGLVVDYLGLANNLKAALRAYIREGDEGGKPIENDKLDIGELVAAMLEKLDLCRSAFFGFNYNDFLVGSPSERLTTVTNAMNFLIGKNYPDTSFIPRFQDQALALQQAFKLASATREAQLIKLEFAFFMAVRAMLSKLNPRGPGGKTEEELDNAVRQLVDQAISPDGVVDIFAVAGLDKPDISILSDAFLLELKDMPQKTLAMELLKKLLNDEIHAKQKTSIVQARRFSEKLNDSLNRYHNRGLETTQIIDALIELAKEIRESEERGSSMGMVKDELAFYDALAENGSAVEVLGDIQLRMIAREVADTVRNNTRIDWQYREQARADLRRHVRRALRKYGYPPDQQETATALVLEQAELFAKEETTYRPLRRG